MALIAETDDDALAAIVSLDGIAAVETVRCLFVDDTGEEIVPGAFPNTGMTGHRLHPVAITGMISTDFTVGIRPA